MNPNSSIQQIMTTELVTAGAEEPLELIRTIFEKNKFHHLPVVGQEGQLLGIISREDFFKVAYALSVESTHRKGEAAAPFGRLTAADIMTKYPLFLNPDDTIGLAADIFLANKFHALPILEEGRLAGLVTSHDLLAYCFNSPIESDARQEVYEEY
jgi:CBS domain-containing protein